VIKTREIPLGQPTQEHKTGTELEHNARNLKSHKNNVRLFRTGSKAAVKSEEGLCDIAMIASYPTA